MNEEVVKQPLNLQEFLAPLRRRKKQLLLVLMALLLATLLLAFGLPSVYRSTGTILIQQQQVPDDLVQSTITSYADQQIQVITQLVMTTRNLLRIIEDDGLYEDERRRLGQTEVIERMRDDITMDLVSANVIDPRSGRATQATIAFTLSFDHESPATAAQVANKLVTLYMNENVRSRSQTAAENESYFTEASADAERRMLELERRLSEFKSQNDGALPEQYALNIQQIQRTEAELLEVQRQWQSASEQLAYLKAQLAQIDPMTGGPSSAALASINPAVQLQALQTQLASLSGQYGPDHPDVVRIKREIDAMRREAGVAPNPSAIEAELAARRNELASLQERYSQEYPDVVRMLRVVANLESDLQRARSWTARAGGDPRLTVADAVSSRINVRESPGTSSPVVGYLYRGESARVIDEAGADWYRIGLVDGTEGYVTRDLTAVVDPGQPAAGTMASNPVFIQLQAQASRADAEMRALVAKNDALQNKLTTLQSRLAQSPEIERQANGLMRDLAIAQEEYQAHQQNLMTAKAGLRLESTAKGERFELIEPPVAPLYPKSPNRLAILFLGLVLSMAGTVGFGAMAGSNDKSFYSARGVASLVGTPPLAVIPYIYLDSDKHRSRRTLLMVAGGILAAVGIGLALIHFLWRPLDVLWFIILRKMGV